MDATSGSARRRGNETGFSLIELLIVVLVLGTLTAVAIVRMAPFREAAAAAACKSDLNAVTSAAGAFGASTGISATTVAELVEGGYLRDYPAGTSATSNGPFVFDPETPSTITRSCT